MVSVYNSLGELVYQQKTNDTDVQIDLSQHAAGMYMIQAQNGLIRIIKQ
jgi:hypothetical protein